MSQDQYSMETGERERIFIAIEPDTTTRWVMAAYQEELQERLRRVPAKWVEQENLHSTLLFVGEITSGEREKVQEIFASTQTPRASTFTTPTLGAFPNMKRANVLVVQFIAPGYFYDYQQELQRKIEESLGCALEERPWKPHLTLARIKNQQALPGDLPEAPTCVWKVSEILLRRSELTQSGPQYQTIAIKNDHGA